MLKDYLKLLEEPGAPLDACVKGRKVILMMADETKETTSAVVTDSIKNTVEDTSTDAIQVRYTSARKKLKHRFVST